MKDRDRINELRQLKKDYLNTFNCEEGKKVMADLERVCFINRTTFPNDSQPISLALNEGMRMVIVHIKNMMNFNVEAIAKLRKEQEDE